MSKFSTQQLLRKRIVSMRRNLPTPIIQHSARHLAQQCKTFQNYKDASKIAMYLAFNGEADPSEIMQDAWRDGKTVLLPVINEERLLFAPYTANSTLIAGKFNIPTPKYADHELLHPTELDLVIMPLVVFDDQLNRIGMGGGYYDKTFAERKTTSQKPQLIGIAHDFQRVDLIAANPWDVPMDLVITEKAVYRNKRA